MTTVMQSSKSGLYSSLPSYATLQDNSIAEAALREGTLIRQSVRITADTETKNINVFQVSGVVEVLDQIAQITDATALSNCTAVYADVWDGTSSYLLTDNTPGLTLSNVPVGSVFFKDKDIAQPYTVLNATTGVVYEPTDWKSGRPFYVVQKSGVPTYIRFNLTTSTILDFTMYLQFYYRAINGSSLTLVS